MACTVQVTLDCHDPHAQADWWAETLGWAVEPQDEEFIRRMIAEGHASEDDTVVHRGALVWREGSAIRSPEPGAPRVLFQLTSDAKAGKNRMHLDVRVDRDADLAATVAALEARGATALWTANQGPHHWTTMADPEGNEFCVSP